MVVLVSAWPRILVQDGRTGHGRQFGLAQPRRLRALLNWSLLAFGAVVLVGNAVGSQRDGLAIDAFNVPHPEQESVETFRSGQRSVTIMAFIFQAVCFWARSSRNFFSADFFLPSSRNTPRPGWPWSSAPGSLLLRMSIWWRSCRFGCWASYWALPTSKPVRCCCPWAFIPALTSHTAMSILLDGLGGESDAMIEVLTIDAPLRMARLDLIRSARSGENGLLHLLTGHWKADAAHVLTGVGDDCSVLRGEGKNHFLLFKTDAVVEGVHFTAHERPELIGRKALARALSDLAAMGASPLGGGGDAWPSERRIGFPVARDLSRDGTAREEISRPPRRRRDDACAAAFSQCGAAWRMPGLSSRVAIGRAGRGFHFCHGSIGRDANAASSAV